MTKYNFPSEFIFGRAVASYQVEGGIYNNDWTHWENKPKTVCNEPCNKAMSLSTNSKCLHASLHGSLHTVLGLFSQ
jgi:beta-glucosidase/6-phospho-beta-glucosidase/beta-galactosidase